MPFIPHTPDDVAEMLAVIGAQRIEDLFDENSPRVAMAQTGAGMWCS